MEELTLTKNSRFMKRSRTLRNSNKKSLDDPFQITKEMGGRYRIGPLGYYTRMDNQPPSGERKPSLTKTITKYMEESAKKEAEHDEWLRKFQEST
ncbi:hypothetical protein Tco_0241240 [Tanacetum coccineum]